MGFLNLVYFGKTLNNESNSLIEKIQNCYSCPCRLSIERTHQHVLHTLHKTLMEGVILSQDTLYVCIYTISLWTSKHLINGFQKRPLKSTSSLIGNSCKIFNFHVHLEFYARKSTTNPNLTWEKVIVFHLSSIQTAKYFTSFVTWLKAENLKWNDSL